MEAEELTESPSVENSDDASLTQDVFLPRDTERAFQEYLTSNPRASTPDLMKRFHLNAVQISLLKKKYFPEISISHADDSSPKSEGEIAAKAFELFENAKSATDAVTSMKISPDQAVSLYHKWVVMKKEDLSGPSIPRIISDLELRIKLLEENKEYCELLFNSVLYMDDFSYYCPKCYVVKINDETASCPKCGYKLPWER